MNLGLTQPAHFSVGCLYTDCLITALKIELSTATAINREENLHRFLPPLQEKCASCVSPGYIEAKNKIKY